jgi:CheY-like chemotaxis protein
VEEILNVLIEIARLDTGRMEPDLTVFALNEVLQRLAVEFEPMARSKGLDLRVVPTSAWVRSDRRLLRRVLQNLISNGIKYTPAGKVLLGVRRRGENVSVQVCDTGHGIPQGKRSIIFKEFQRLEETAGSVRGLGLGLSIVERIGKVLHHPVQLESIPGRGSVFSVELPRAEARAGAQAAELPAQPAGRLSGLRVVCIDNEPAVLQGMQTLLSGWGCTVITARSGDEALAQLKQGLQPPDIVLADYHLDEGTGTGAIATLRAATHLQIPAVIITADHSAEVLREVRLKGHALLRKPLKAAALRALMHQLTWRRRAVAAE